MISIKIFLLIFALGMRSAGIPTFKNIKTDMILYAFEGDSNGFWAQNKNE